MGYNFIPRKKDGSNVIRDKQGKVIQVKPEWEGQEFSFVIKDGKIILEKINGAYPDIPKIILRDMRKQVEAVSSGKKGKKKKTKRKSAKSKKNLKPVSRAYLAKADRNRLEILKNSGIEYLSGGWIRIRHWTTIRGIKMITPKLVKDIDAAIRMQEKHILAGYKGSGNKKGEIAILNKMKKIVGEANDLYAHWIKSDPRRPDIIQNKLTAAFLQLINCHNELKVAAADNIAEAMPLEDRLDRVNPGAKAALTVAALNRLDDRFNELRIIMPIIALRQELLLFEKNWMEIQVKQACLYLRSTLHRPRDHFQNRISDIDQKIGQVIYILDTMWPTPFFEKAQKSKTYLQEAKKFIRGKKITEAKKIVNSSIKILRAN